MRIAFIGSMEYDEEALEAFFDKLQAKYPEAVIYTGDGLGAERQVAWNCSRTGLPCIITPKHPEAFGRNASDAQISGVLKGNWTAGIDDGDPAPVEVLVIVGDPKGSRPSVALAWWKRCYEREGRVLYGLKMPVLHKLVKIAEVPKEAKVAKRARSKKKREAQAAA